MSSYSKLRLTDFSDGLSYDIEKAYARYGINIEIKGSFIMKDRIIFEVKLKKDTRESQVSARAPDVQLRLKLPLFQVSKKRFTIFIAASKSEIKYDGLPEILESPAYQEAKGKLELPYVVGHKVTGELIISDLFEEKHLLIGGASGSGKTVALWSLALSIIMSKPPSEVNLMFIDVGANDLMPFNGISHLSGPVARDNETALHYLIALKEEMDRRIDLEYSNPNEFRSLPRIICVIDEFPALISGMGDKELSKQLVVITSNLLNRGRHAKVHMVLAAQNPTLQNIKVDLGNITARMAFQCAKRNHSETIIGEAGAEHLSGAGDMYFKSSQNGLLRIQGAFTSPDELMRLLSTLKTSPHEKGESSFVLSDTVYHEADYGYSQARRPMTTKQDADDRLFAEVMIWVLGHKEVSCNSLMKRFNIGWNRASTYLERLHMDGVVGNVFTKMPRLVHITSPDDLTPDTLDFLHRRGYRMGDIQEALNAKHGSTTQFGFGS